MSVDLIVSTSTEYLPVANVTKKDEGIIQDPTADTVAVAFVAPDAIPASGDFNAAVWDTDATGSKPVYRVLCLVGSGGVALTPGEYKRFVKLTDSPEVPIKPVPGLLTVL